MKNAAASDMVFSQNSYNEKTIFQGVFLKPADNQNKRVSAKIDSDSSVSAHQFHILSNFSPTFCHLD